MRLHWTGKRHVGIKNFFFFFLFFWTNVTNFQVRSISSECSTVHLHRGKSRGQTHCNYQPHYKHKKVHPYAKCKGVPIEQLLARRFPHGFLVRACFKHESHLHSKVPFVQKPCWTVLCIRTAVCGLSRTATSMSHSSTCFWKHKLL